MAPSVVLKTCTIIVVVSPHVSECSDCCAFFLRRVVVQKR